MVLVHGNLAKAAAAAQQQLELKETWTKARGNLGKMVMVRRKASESTFAVEIHSCGHAENTPKCTWRLQTAFTYVYTLHAETMHLYIGENHPKEPKRRFIIQLFMYVDIDVYICGTYLSHDTQDFLFIWAPPWQLHWRSTTS